MNKYVKVYFLLLALMFTACNQVAENTYQDTKEYQLYVEYLDQIKAEKMKFYVLGEDFSPAKKKEKRELEERIDQFIETNNLYFQSEPTELERLEFLNLLNEFIDSQVVDEEIKQNVKRYWALTFSPMRDELRDNFLKVSGLKKEQLLTVFQNRR